MNHNNSMLYFLLPMCTTSQLFLCQRSKFRDFNGVDRTIEARVESFSSNPDVTTTTNAKSSLALGPPHKYFFKAQAQTHRSLTDRLVGQCISCASLPTPPEAGWPAFPRCSHQPSRSPPFHLISPPLQPNSVLTIRTSMSTRKRKQDAEEEEELVSLPEDSEEEEE